MSLQVGREDVRRGGRRLRCRSPRPGSRRPISFSICFACCDTLKSDSPGSRHYSAIEEKSQHHIRFGLENRDRRIAKARQLLGVRVGNILDHHEVRVSGELVGPAQTVDRFRDSGPDHRVVLVRCERNAVHAPRKEIAADEHFFVQTLESRPGLTRCRCFTQAGHGDCHTLSSYRGDGFPPTKDKRIALAEIVRPRFFKHAQITTRKEERIVRGHSVPMRGVEVVDAVGKCKAESTRRCRSL